MMGDLVSSLVNPLLLELFQIDCRSSGKVLKVLEACVDVTEGEEEREGTLAFDSVEAGMNTLSQEGNPNLRRSGEGAGGNSGQ